MSIVFFPENLAEARKRHGLTMRKLSIMSGVHENTIARIERGEFNPSEKTIDKLVEALRIDKKLLCKNDADLTGVEKIRYIQKILDEKLKLVIEIHNKLNMWIEKMPDTPDIEESALLCIKEIMREVNRV